MTLNYITVMLETIFKKLVNFFSQYVHKDNIQSKVNFTKASDNKNILWNL